MRSHFHSDIGNRLKNLIWVSLNTGDHVEDNKTDIFLVLFMRYLRNKWLIATQPSTVENSFCPRQQECSDGSSTEGYERSESPSNRSHWHIQSSCLYKLLPCCLLTFLEADCVQREKKACHCKVLTTRCCCELNFNSSRNFFALT